MILSDGNFLIFEQIRLYFLLEQQFHLIGDQ